MGARRGLWGEVVCARRLFYPAEGAEEVFHALEGGGVVEGGVRVGFLELEGAAVMEEAVDSVRVDLNFAAVACGFHFLLEGEVLGWWAGGVVFSYQDEGWRGLRVDIVGRGDCWIPWRHKLLGDSVRGFSKADGGVEEDQGLRDA